jgi:DNA repair exonuclease SbcCD ATPase subunit
LNEQRKLVETLAKSLENSRAALIGLQEWRSDREAELAGYMELINRQEEIEADYKAWQKARTDLRKMDSAALQFRAHDDKRQPILREIETEKARLEQELRGLEEQEKVISDQASVGSELEEKIGEAEKSLVETETKINERGDLEKKIISSRERLAELKTENERLRIEMDELKSRIDKLQVAEGATCPLCGQELSEAHRKATLKELGSEGKTKGDCYRTNTTEMKKLAEEISIDDAKIVEMSKLDGERLLHSNTVSQLKERFDLLEKQSVEWGMVGAVILQAKPKRNWRN